MATPNDPYRFDRSRQGAGIPRREAQAPTPAAPQRERPVFSYTPGRGVGGVVSTGAAAAPAAVVSPPAAAPAAPAPTPAPAPAAPAAPPQPPAERVLGTFQGRDITQRESDTLSGRFGNIGTGVAPDTAGGTPGVAVVNADGSIAMNRPTGPAQTNGTMPRRSMLDEFSAIREGLVTPRAYDPTSAASSARRAATDVTRSTSDENRLIQMAANIASDPRLKGFPGARNAIIAGLVGQLDAGNAAALEGLRQSGQAGLGLQGFEQDSVLQESGRRGVQLRDAMLADNAERLARINNDADMAQTVRQGEFALEGARLGASRRSGSDPALEYANDVYERNLDVDGVSPQAAAILSLNELAASGVAVEDTPVGNFGRRSVNEALAAANNSDEWTADDYEVVPADGVNNGQWQIEMLSPWQQLWSPTTWGERGANITSPRGAVNTIGEDQLPEGVTFDMLTAAINNERAIEERLARRSGQNSPQRTDR